MLRSRLLILALFAAYGMLFFAHAELSSVLPGYVPHWITLNVLALMNPIPHIAVVVMDMHRSGMDVLLFVVFTSNLAFWLLIGYLVGALRERSRKRRERRRDLP